MVLSRAQLYERMNVEEWDRRLVVDPFFEPPESAHPTLVTTLDFHLGNRFLLSKRGTGLGVSYAAGDGEDDTAFTKEMYVPNGRQFPIYPRQLVLGVTLEWLRLPPDLMGAIVDRSAWGRHGLMISIATAIHPGASGNITLEITNLGETVVFVQPGQALGQLQFMLVGRTDEENKRNASSTTNGWCAMVRPELKPYRHTDVEKFLMEDPRQAPQ